MLKDIFFKILSASISILTVKRSMLPFPEPEIQSDFFRNRDLAGPYGLPRLCWTDHIVQSG